MKSTTLLLLIVVLLVATIATVHSAEPKLPHNDGLDGNANKQIKSDKNILYLRLTYLFPKKYTTYWNVG